MGLEDFLSAEDKVAALEALRNRTFSELYTTCIRAGVDPDTLDYETWELPPQDETNTMQYTLLIAVLRLCNMLKIIDLKIGK
jgi:hypothetical protein